MALFRGIQEYIALDANNITLVFDSGNIVNISGNIFLYPPQGHPILYNYFIEVYMCYILKLDYRNIEIHIAIAITYSNDKSRGNACHYFLIHLSNKMEYFKISKKYLLRPDGKTLELLLPSVKLCSFHIRFRWA